MDEYTLDDVSSFALAAHLAADDFITLHLVTGARAARAVSQLLDDDTARRLAAHMVPVMAIAYAAVGAPPLLDAAELDALRGRELSVPRRDRGAGDHRSGSARDQARQRRPRRGGTHRRPALPLRRRPRRGPGPICTDGAGATLDRSDVVVRHGRRYIDIAPTGGGGQVGVDVASSGAESSWRRSATSFGAGSPSDQASATMTRS